MPTASAAVERALDDLGLASRAAAAGRDALRRMEAAPRARRVHAASAAAPAARRADRGRRSESAPRVLGRAARLAAQGISVLVSTHYMDEAERCHKLAYIAYGRLLAQGTAHEVIAAQGLTTFSVRGADLTELAERLRTLPGVEQTVAFGETVHVSGTDAARSSERCARRPPAAATTSRPSPTGLEDVFIHLMQGATDNFGDGQRRQMNGARFSLRSAGGRWSSRSSCSCAATASRSAMMVGIPIIQLTLFGYAINTDPKHMPTALIVADHSEFTRTFVQAMSDVGLLQASSASCPTRKRAARRSRRAACSSSSRFPPISRASSCAASGPSILIEADASDPTATSDALAASSQLVRPVARKDLDRAARARSPATPPPFEVRRAPALQPRVDHAIQHRARADGRDPDDDDGDDDRPRDHARARARHDGEPARDAAARRSR